VDRFVDIISAAGYPTTIAGGIVFLFFYLRKQEAAIRTTTREQIADLEEDLERRRTEILRLEEELRAIKKLLTESQDESIIERRRAEAAEARLRSAGLE
jgi:predicted phage gp36 major capsid-like protein